VLENIEGCASLELRTFDLWMLLDCCGRSLEDAGRAICEEVRRVDSDPIMVGYSLGGRLGLHALLHDPSLWKSAIFLSAHTGLRDEDEKKQRLRQDAEWAVRAKRDDFGEFLSAWDDQSVLLKGGGPKPKGRMALEVRRHAIARGFVSWSLGGQRDFLVELQSSRELPQTLWLAGERDEKFSLIARRAAESNERAEFQSVANAGHRLLVDAPEVVANAIASMV